MSFLPQLIFLIILIATGFFLIRRVRVLRRNILLGKPEARNDQPGKRWKAMLLVAFGQQKMFKRFIPAFLHFFVYVGFLVINLEVLEFVVDGVIGGHRLFAPFLGGAYVVAMNIFEFLAVTVLLSCVVFLVRRNVVKVPRLAQPDLKGWPAMDANIILVIEIVLMIAILTMNAADQILASRGVGNYITVDSLFFSGLVRPVFEQMSSGFLVFLERAAWWFHIVGILAFAIYVTYSKHLHIFLAFPNTWYTRLKPKGQMENMPAVTNEVNMMLGIPSEAPTDAPMEIARFGAKDINDLSWINIMNAFSCTECGRCTAECPANITGKKLSPRKIMMDVRDRAEEVGKSLDVGGKGLEDGKSLLGDYITKEELNACTSCNACVEACPVNIDPLAIILEMRRYVAMEESGTPAQWNAMFQNMETSFSPWKFSPQDRFNWAEKVKEEDIK
ncbi:4Fe-4S dicluster domain-containing protein [Algoriphagus sp. AGSA1]|uniref:4Fe-4S dicluster domain-containing protein n=1 Tax=Algoriphagus sp. AGSA1 TaxID=2907213 RepID=UPI001F2B2430|nr:4Fe-4S dicluster domain-containing protein [Algoriphagus sp. AGSA1]MCE7056980.1 4Fe-4S dicluster domain-containing protein [Algoriphagus sp. AGSA1]